MAGLNQMQDMACKHVDGPLLILAGAGSGKTRVLTHRVAYLMDECEVNPYNILAITFTNKAAAEMRERVNNIVGEGAECVWVSTFHSLCVRILRRFADRIGFDTNFNIYDSDDQKAAIKHILKELRIDSKKYPEKMFLADISKAKERYISPDEYAKMFATDFVKSQIANVYLEYAKRLRRFNAFDFDDLIYKTVELFEHHPDILEYYQERFHYIMVDEYQDTNNIQFILVKQLAARYRNLCVVGDDDQSIYKFRGANITNILNFEKVYPDAKVVKLEQNYRSVGNILNAANAVIKHNESRKDKRLWTDKGDGDKVSFFRLEDEYQEAEKVVSEIRNLTSKGVAYKDIAILYRTNAQSRVLGERLVLRGIPHRVYGGQNFYERKEIRDMMAYLKVVNNDADNTYIRRIINVPKRGIGEASVEKVISYASACDITLMEALHRANEVPGLARAAEKIKTFAELIDSFKSILEEREPLSALFDSILEETGYQAELIAEQTDEAVARLENIDELRNRVVQFETEYPEASLADFLEDTALVSELDKMDDDDNMVRLMTLHGSKGLEFPYVFICGMEEQIFPSYMSIISDDEDALGEERRLCYVGITRAMEKLYLTCAKFRMSRGSRTYNDISRFIKEIPQNLLDDAGEVRRNERRKAERENRVDDYNNPFADLGFVARPKKPASRSYSGSNPYSSYGKLKQGGATGEAALQNAGLSKGFGGANAATTVDYGVGDKVKHIKFGVGVVTELVQGGKDYEVTVDFERVGIKKMFASFAKLKRVN